MNYSIGIDVGKKEMVACVRRSDGVTKPSISLSNNSAGLKKFLHQIDNHGKETPILFESTGPYHWQWARELSRAGWNARVVNPILTKKVTRLSIRKRKTDKVDAEHLAFLAGQGYGYSFQETERSAYVKGLTRHYWKLKAILTNCTLHEQYLESYRGISRFKIRNRIKTVCDRLRGEIIQECNQGNDLRYLDSIPGVTPILAATILAELYPLSRFDRIEQIIAYAGLDPAVKQSGGKPAKYSAVSKRGSPTFRKVLFFAAFGAFTRPPFKTHYDGYKKRGLHHTAVLCILARKILRIAIALLKKREVFKEQYLTADKSA